MCDPRENVTGSDEPEKSGEIQTDKSDSDSDSHSETSSQSSSVSPNNTPKNNQDTSLLISNRPRRFRKVPDRLKY